MKALAPTVQDRLFRLWSYGTRPRITADVINREFGTRLGFKDVRQAFIEISERMA